MFIEHVNKISLHRAGLARDSMPVYTVHRPLYLRVGLEPKELSLLGSRVYLRLFGYAQTTQFEHDPHNLSFKSRTVSRKKVLDIYTTSVLSSSDNLIAIDPALLLSTAADVPSSLRVTGLPSMAGVRRTLVLENVLPTTFEVRYWLELQVESITGVAVENLEEVCLVNSNPSYTTKADQVRPSDLIRVIHSRTWPLIGRLRFNPSRPSRRIALSLSLPRHGYLIFREHSDSGLISVPLMLCMEGPSAGNGNVTMLPDIHVQWSLASRTEFETREYMPTTHLARLQINRCHVQTGKKLHVWDASQCRNSDAITSQQVSQSLLIFVNDSSDLTPSFRGTDLERSYELCLKLKVDPTWRCLGYHWRGEHTMGLTVVYDHGQPPEYEGNAIPPQYA